MTTYALSGTTRDANGNALGSCDVMMFTTSTDAFVTSTTSNGSGAFTFTGLASNAQVYLVAYLTGSPDVAGTTLNNLVPIAEGVSGTPIGLLLSLTTP